MFIDYVKIFMNPESNFVKYLLTKLFFSVLLYGLILFLMIT